MSETDALGNAKFGSGVFLTDFPVKIRVLTLDPLVHTDNYGNTRYAFVVYNVDENIVQVLDKGPGFASSFQSIHTDEDLSGGDIRRIDVKIKTNGKSGKETRYEFNTVGTPSDLTQEQLKVIKDSSVDLDTIIKKNSPNALRLSEINAGKKLKPAEYATSSDDLKDKDVIIEDIDDKPIDLGEIPF